VTTLSVASPAGTMIHTVRGGSSWATISGSAKAGVTPSAARACVGSGL
jgi:hypothetical protein